MLALSLTLEMCSPGRHLKPLILTRFCNIYSIESKKMCCVDFNFYQVPICTYLPKSQGFNEILIIDISIALTYLKTDWQLFKTVKMDWLL